MPSRAARTAWPRARPCRWSHSAPSLHTSLAAARSAGDCVTLLVGLHAVRALCSRRGCPPLLLCWTCTPLPDPGPTSLAVLDVRTGPRSNKAPRTAQGRGAVEAGRDDLEELLAV